MSQSISLPDVQNRAHGGPGVDLKQTGQTRGRNTIEQREHSMFQKHEHTMPDSWNLENSLLIPSCSSILPIINRMSARRWPDCSVGEWKVREQLLWSLQNGHLHDRHYFRSLALFMSPRIRLGFTPFSQASKASEASEDNKR